MSPENRCTWDSRTTPSCSAACCSVSVRSPRSAGHQLLEPGRLHPGRSRLPGHQVAQHRAGLDRRELVGVADQHQPAVVGRSASTSRAIRVSDTIDASSTTTTS